MRPDKLLTLERVGYVTLSFDPCLEMNLSETNNWCLYYLHHLLNVRWVLLSDFCPRAHYVSSINNT